MNEEHDFPELSGNDPVVERMVRRSRKSKVGFRYFLWCLGCLGVLGVCWCISLAVTGQYEKLGVVAGVFAVIVGGTLKGFRYLRTLEALENR